MGDRGVGNGARRRSSQHHRERASSLVGRMLVGVIAFAWAPLLFFLIRMNPLQPDPYWPLYPIVGGLFGAAATLATRDAGQRPLGRLLAALGYISICGILAIFLSKPNKMWPMTLLPFPYGYSFHPEPVTAKARG